MPGVYAAIAEVDVATTQERLATILELRAADPQQRAMLDSYLSEVEFAPSARVLDVGCGTGAVTRVLARRPRVAEAVGVDPSSVFVAKAGELAAELGNVSLEEGDGRALRFGDGDFDVVVCHTVLCHVPEPERVLAEACVGCRRCCGRPGSSCGFAQPRRVLWFIGFASFIARSRADAARAWRRQAAVRRYWARWPTAVMASETSGRFKRWFWRPPRAHGEIIADRQVSVLELFYDLVYVAVLGQAAHQLAGHVSVRGLVEFAVVFALIWIAWINGSLYLELHGREDGRTRSIVFAQMGILVLLAVFTADAVGGGWGFAVVYATYQVFQTWLWSTVWRQDRRDHREFLPTTAGYVVGVGVSAMVILASALLPATSRLLVWAGLGVAWIVGITLAARASRAGLGLIPTDSLVERFGLFIIIVLGEVVIGVVDGLSVAERDAKTIVTGMLALSMGFGFWWIYFDLVGSRRPRASRVALANWVMSHLPIALAITAAGAGMVSLIGHAHDATTPAGTSWLLAGAVASGLLALIFTEQALADAERLSVVFHPLRLALAGGAVAALIVGWLRPAPWLLAVLLVAILSAVWLFAVSRFLRADAWGEP